MPNTKIKETSDYENFELRRERFHEQQVTKLAAIYYTST